MKKTNPIVVISNIVSIVLIAALIVMQFVPFWYSVNGLHMTKSQYLEYVASEPYVSTGEFTPVVEETEAATEATEATEEATEAVEEATEAATEATEAATEATEATAAEVTEAATEAATETPAQLASPAAEVATEATEAATEAATEEVAAEATEAATEAVAEEATEAATEAASDEATVDIPPEYDMDQYVLECHTCKGELPRSFHNTKIEFTFTKDLIKLKSSHTTSGKEIKQLCDLCKSEEGYRAVYVVKSVETLANNEKAAEKIAEADAVYYFDGAKNRLESEAGAVYAVLLETFKDEIKLTSMGQRAWFPEADAPVLMFHVAIVLFGIVSIIFCFTKRNASLNFLPIGATGICSTVGYFTSAEAQTGMLWILPAIIGALVIVPALVLLFFWIKGVIRWFTVKER